MMTPAVTVLVVVSCVPMPILITVCAPALAVQASAAATPNEMAVSLRPKPSSPFKHSQVRATQVPVHDGTFG